MRYYIIAGEASGDIHTSKLMEGIRANDPEAQFRFWGGDRMVSVGGKENLVAHYKDSAIMGFSAVFRNIGKLLKRFRYCEQDILSYSPDVVILVDYAGFNLRIAKFTKKHNIKTFYYIAPKVWAWDEKRVKKIRKYVDELFVIFPFEVEYFAKHGIKAHYFGNPLVEEVESSREGVISREEFLNNNSLTNKPIIALLAGSRVKEIEHNLPFMSDVASHFPDYQFVIAGVNWIDNSVYERIIDNKAQNLTLLCDDTYNILLHSEAAIVTSGTATLETALLGVPEVVCYYASRLGGAIFMFIAKVKYISLVNLILGRESVRELFSAKLMTVENAVNELNAILPNGSKRDRMLSDYRELREMVGESGSSYRTASAIVKKLLPNS